jgi:hypothetical protein
LAKTPDGPAKKMVLAVGFEPTKTGFSRLFIIAFRCLFVRLPTDYHTDISLVFQGFYCIFEQQPALKVVRDCALVRTLCGSLKLAEFCA